MTVKTAAKSFGHGALNVLAAVTNATIQNQIHEIDSEIDALETQLKELKERRADLESRKI